MDTVIQIADLSKKYTIWSTPRARLCHVLTANLPLVRRPRHKEASGKVFHALESLTLEIKKGESVGIVGRNGSGKSTLLQMIAGTLQPSTGSVKTQGRIAALLELGSGFNPDYTGKENVYFSAALLGFSKQQISDAYEAIADFANIGDFMDQPIKNYSSGMQVRLAFAVYTMVNPDILIVDEALAVGDEGFQRKCYRRLETLREAGTTLLFVSHSAASIVRLCNRAIWLERGRLICDAEPKETMAAYHRFTHLHPNEREAFLKADNPSIPGGPGHEEEQAIPEDTDSSLLDASLIPQSYDEYPQRGAYIQNCRIQNESSKVVNVLKRNSTYTFQYEVSFLEDCHGVFFAMYMKALNGTELGGATNPTASNRIGYIPAGSKRTISFRFKCLLTNGVYFINAGVEKLENEQSVFAHRVVDSAMFRVIPEHAITATGMLDFQIESEILSY